MIVRRTLPHRERHTIGAWCFADDFGPESVVMSVPPHPHIGLQTVSWLYAGRVRHRDSLGNDQLIHPGQVNLMTAGRGVAHSEHSASEGPLHGLQLWVALPADRRTEPAGFEHVASPPRVQGGGWRALVLVGEFAGVASPVTTYSPLVGAEVSLRAGATALLPRRPDFEYGVLVAHGQVAVDGREVTPGPLLYLPPGAGGTRVFSEHGARFMLLGGAPFRDPLVMWWNFVAGSHEEIVSARADWQAGRRFGAVPGGEPVLPAPPMPTTRLRTRI